MSNLGTRAKFQVLKLIHTSMYVDVEVQDNYVIPESTILMFFVGLLRDRPQFTL